MDRTKPELTAYTRENALQSVRLGCDILFTLVYTWYAIERPSVIIITLFRPLKSRGTH